jgi:transcriptional regulator with XRE-family HTH domain
VNSGPLFLLADGAETVVMERSAAELRGEVLRAWREYAGVTNAQLARDLHTSPPSISMWESGDRASRADSRMPLIHDIAQALGLPADQAVAFEEMWSAAGSVTVVPPRQRWAHNFQAPGSPGWAWVRPREVGEDGTATLHVTNWWSEALQGSRKFTCGAAGVLLHYATTVTNPPLEVSLSSAGSVNFGRGVVPADVAARLGAVLVDAREIVTFSLPIDPPLTSDDQREARSVLSRAREVALNLGLGWRIFAPHAGMIRPHHAAHSLDGSSLQPTAWPGQTVTDSEGHVERQALVPTRQLRALREGRGMSREQVVHDVNALDPLNPVTARAIEVMEATGKFPDVRGVVAALDHIYRCDGRLGLDRVFDSVALRPSSGNHYTIRFPAYYVGPIWVQATGRDANDAGLIDLTWGPWRRRQRVRSAMLLTTRKARPDSVPLLVAIPRGWRLVAGTGAAPSAADINHGWHPVSIRAGIAVLREGVEAVIASQRFPTV